MELFNRSTEEGDVPYQMEEALSEVSKDLITELRRSFSFLQSEFGSDPDQRILEWRRSTDFFSPMDFR